MRAPGNSWPGIAGLKVRLEEVKEGLTKEQKLEPWCEGRMGMYCQEDRTASAFQAEAAVCTKAGRKARLSCAGRQVPRWRGSGRGAPKREMAAEEGMSEASGAACQNHWSDLCVVAG